MAASTDSSADTSPLLPQSLSGTVAANSRPDRPLIQTPIGLLSLANPSDLAPGSLVELVVIGLPTLPTQPVEDDQADWFADLVTILRQAAPKAMSPVSGTMADAGERLANALIGLTSGLQTGSLQPWLGEAALHALIKAGGETLVKRLERHLAESKTAVRLSSGGDWQSMILPFQFDQRIERVRLVVRRPPRDDAEAKTREEEGTRFLVDVEMSRLGAVQLDGLVKRKAKRFDLIVRSQGLLPEAMRRDIAGIFAQALDGLGMAGTASFQHTTGFIEAIPQGIPPTSGWVI